MPKRGARAASERVRPHVSRVGAAAVAVAALPAMTLSTTGALPAGATQPTTVGGIRVLPPDADPASIHLASPIPTDPHAIASDIASDMVLRQELGFRSSKRYVADLYAHPAKTMGVRTMALLTRPEYEELLRRFELHNDAIRIRNYVLSTPHLKAQYAGVYLDQKVGKLVVRFTNLTSAEERAVRQRTVLPDRLVIEPAKHTLAELQAVQHRFENLVTEHRLPAADKAAITAAYADVPTNSFRVGVESLPSEQSAAASMAADDVTDSLEHALGLSADAGRALITEYQHARLPDVSTCGYTYGNNCFTPGYTPGSKYFMGDGIWTEITSDNQAHEFCTMGIPVKDLSDPSSGYLLTAGHCLDTQALGTKVSFNWTSKSDIGFAIGTSVGWQDDSYTDMGLIKLYSSTGYNGVVSQPLASLSSSGESSYLTGGYTQSDSGNTHYVTGDTMCAAQAKSNRTICGTVANPNGSDGSTNNLVYMNFSSQVGDSGGPLTWYDSTLQAILWVGLAHTGASQSTFVSIDQIGEFSHAMGVTLVPRFNNGMGEVPSPG